MSLRYGVSPYDGHIVNRNVYRKAINILRKIVHQFGSIYKITRLSNNCLLGAV